MDDKQLPQPDIPEKPKFELKINEQVYEEFGDVSPEVEAQMIQAAQQQKQLSEQELMTQQTMVLDTNIAEDDDQQPPPKKKFRALGIIIRVIIAGIVLGTCAALSTLIINVSGDVFGLNESEQIKEISVERGSSITDIANLLKSEGIIEYPDAFRLYIKYRSPNVSFSFGKFQLHPAMAYDDLIQELQKPQTAKLTFKEGQNIYEYAQILQDAGICDKEDFLNALNQDYPEYDFLPTLDMISSSRVYRLEGFLFPDTYEFFLDEQPQTVVKTFLNNFKAKYSDEMIIQTQNLQVSVDFIVNLAAIIQAEAPILEEMKNVSSVYWNRYRNPEEYPKMESDPTAKYANQFLQSHGVSQTAVEAYNTYLTPGLPPGAINNPGLEAIQAALWPSKTNYYFFCTNLDTLDFYYAKTYEQHQKNLLTAGLTENNTTQPES